ncbi:MAG: glycosyltransferase family 4 protein [Pseudomonadota bacterium]
MKVVIFSRMPADMASPRGGVETATIGLLRGLMMRSDVELHVVTLEKKRSSIVVEEMGGVTVHRLPGNPWPMFLDIFFGPGKKLLQKYIRSLKPDIVHFQETYGLGMFDIGIPHTFTVHGFDSLNLGAEKKSLWKLRTLLWRRAEAYGLSKQRHIVSITPYVRREIEPLTSAKIHDIDNAISREFFEIPRNERPGRIFFAGWLNPRKNALGLIRAFMKVVAAGVDAQLHIAGEPGGETEYYQAIQKAIEENHLEPRVRLLGRLNQQEIRKELSEASVFVLPSYQENAPMAIAEAMAARVPVVSSNVCGMPYMIQEGKTGFLVSPDDHESLAHRLIQLLTNAELRSNISASARREAEERYHPLAVATKTMAMYRDIILHSK